MPRAGEVYHFPDFVFPDGEQAHKFVVLLGQILGGDWILGRTTSRQRGRPTNPRCNQAHDASYFIGALPGIFPVPTWLVLDRLDDSDRADFERKLASGKVGLRGMLPFDVFCEALSCARGAVDTTVMQANAMSDVRAALGCP